MRERRFQRIGLAAVVAALAAVGAAGCHTAPPPDPNAPKRLTPDVAVTGQVTPDRVAALKAAGFRTIVNMRPDGEAPGQPNYADMLKAVQGAGLAYGYVPIRAGATPKASIEALASTLNRMPKPVLLYSEPPQRAATAWALAEASRPGGLDAAAIDAAMKSAGQSDANVHSEIAARIAARR